jgi:hypothetical protein
MTGFRAGDVVKYVPADRFDRWWCREGTAIATQRDGDIILVDTYWGSGSDNHVLRDDETATATLKFNLGDFDELPSRPGVRLAWGKYAPADRELIPSQHGLQCRYFIRKGAAESLPTQVENATQALIDAESELRSAQWRVESRAKELAELRALVGAS